jgi:hypothetical protein
MHDRRPDRSQAVDDFEVCERIDHEAFTVMARAGRCSRLVHGGCSDTVCRAISAAVGHHQHRTVHDPDPAAAARQGGGASARDRYNTAERRQESRNRSARAEDPVRRQDRRRASNLSARDAGRGPDQAARRHRASSRRRRDGENLLAIHRCTATVAWAGATREKRAFAGPRLNRGPEWSNVAVKTRHQGTNGVQDRGRRQSRCLVGRPRP